MAHTYTSLHSHFVFSTAGRRNLIPQDYLGEVHAYMGGIARNLRASPVAIGGTANHVHLLLGVPPTVSASEVVGKIKANLSRWASDQFPTMEGFRWQEGYGAFSVSRSQVDAVRTYIATQAEHHKTMTFEQEFLAFLTKHGIEFDVQHVFD